MNRAAKLLTGLSAGLLAPVTGGAAARPADGTWRVDRIRVDGVTDPAGLATLKDDHSMGAVAAHLRRLGLAFRRETVSLRLADLPGGLVAELSALPPGEPFVLPADGGVTVNARLDGAAGAAPVWHPAIPGQPDAARLAAARRFLDAAIPPAERDHFFDQLVAGTIATLVAGVMQTPQLHGLIGAHPALGPVFARFTGRQRDLVLADLHAHLPELIEAQAIGYARLFSADELDRLAGFFGQPLGRKYLQQSLLLPAQPEMAAWQAGMAARTQARVPAEVTQLMADVQAALAREKHNDVL